MCFCVGGVAMAAPFFFAENAALFNLPLKVSRRIKNEVVNG